MLKKFPKFWSDMTQRRVGGLSSHHEFVVAVLCRVLLIISCVTFGLSSRCSPCTVIPDCYQSYLPHSEAYYNSKSCPINSDNERILQ